MTRDHHRKPRVAVRVAAADRAARSEALVAYFGAPVLASVLATGLQLLLLLR